MRIALIYLGRRGSGGWITFELAQQLQNQFSVLTVTSAYLEQKELRDALQTDHQIVTPTFHNVIQALLTLVFPRKLNQLAHDIKTYKPDVMLFPMFHPWNAHLQARLKHIPSVVFIHDPDPHPDLAGWFYAHLETTSLERADRCIILSENLRDVMLRRGISNNRLDVIPHGLFRLSHPRSPLQKTYAIPTLLFFGRIAPYKGLQILLQAYRVLRQTHRARLIVAGEGNLKSFAATLKTLPDVTVINRWVSADEIETIFSESDLVILPYTSASQSGVIPIAAAFGLPVIATRTGGITEQIETDKSGWLVEPGNIDALIDAMKEALDKPEIASQRGEALRRRYEDKFNWDQVAHQVAESLQNAVQARGQA